MNILSGSQEPSEEALYMETNSAAEGRSRAASGLLPFYGTKVHGHDNENVDKRRRTATTATMQWK